MAYATWERKEEFVAEAFLLQSLLVQALRDIGLEEEHRQEDHNSHSNPNPTTAAAAPVQQQQQPGPSSLKDAWLAWVRQESVRRSKLIAFTFLHTHSVAYNVYPVLRSNEIHLRLPCPTGEWQAPTAAQWQRQRERQSRHKRREQLNFQDALSLLLRRADDRGAAAPLDPIPTPLGNYVLLHGLLQRIHIVRDLSLPIMDQSASLPAEEVNKLEYVWLSSPLLCPLSIS